MISPRPSRCCATGTARPASAADMSAGQPRLARMAPSGGSDFVHLHAHTEYSMLDGAARLDDLFAETNRLGQKAMATTDHGFLFGAYYFWKQATAAGVKPIIGVEAYL